jgi:hypothetical protein
MTTFSLAPVGAAADSLGREPLVAEVSRISAPIGATAMLAGWAAVPPIGAVFSWIFTPRADALGVQRTRWAGHSVTGIVRALQLLVTECQAHVSALSCPVILSYMLSPLPGLA